MTDKHLSTQFDAELSGISTRVLEMGGMVESQISRAVYALTNFSNEIASEVLITADCGGSNGNRVRLWKSELAAFAAQTGLRIRVCHLPPGTSKWNRIEHKLFSFISMNWRGRPLTSHEVIVNTIGATTTRTGLRVQAELDTGIYPKGTKIGDREMKELEKTRITRDHWHGEWNYTIHPATTAKTTDEPNSNVDSS